MSASIRFAGPRSLACSFLLLAAAAATGQICPSGANSTLVFDGVDDGMVVTAPPSATLDGFADFTFECWFRADAVGNGGQPTLLNKLGGAGLSYWLGLDSGKYYLWLNNTAVLTVTSGMPDVRDGIWHHAAVVRSGSAVTAYLDGAIVGVATHSGTILVTPTSFAAGRRADGAFPQFLKGALDEIRIWNIARSAALVQAHRFTALSGGEAGLVGYWRCDNGSGQFVTDFSTNGATATLGATAAAAADDPAWSAVNLPPIPYCGGSGAGNANSSAASLQVNGIGAIGVAGPFVVTPAGGSLTLSWAGPPGQSLILATGPLNPGSGTLPGFGTIDLGTPPTWADVTFLLNGLIPPLSYIMVTNGAGTAVQTFSLPSLAGVTFAVQGMVFQPIGTTPYGALLTAAFNISL